MFMLLFVLLVLVGGGGLSFPLFLLGADLIAAIAWCKWGYGNLTK